MDANNYFFIRVHWRSLVVAALFNRKWTRMDANNYFFIRVHWRSFVDVSLFNRKWTRINTNIFFVRVHWRSFVDTSLRGGQVGHGLGRVGFGRLENFVHAEVGKERTFLAEG